VKLDVRSAADVIADVATWPARLAAILGDATPAEKGDLAEAVSLFGQLAEPTERAVLERQHTQQEADRRALGLALQAPADKDSKGPGQQPGALRQHSHTGPYPEETAMQPEIRAPEDRSQASEAPAAPCHCRANSTSYKICYVKLNCL